MYGQANYGPQFGQGPQIPRPPAQQQHPPAPPNLQFPQGPQAPMPPLVQRASPAIPPQMSQSGPHLYQHCRPARSPLVHPGPPPVQVPPIGTSNIGESYRHPLPSVHGSTPVVSQTYSSGQQAQHSSHMGAQNVHYNPTIAPLSHGPSRPEMLGGPQTLGALPPLPQAQGQTSYRASFCSPPPYPGGVQGLKHIPPPPPPSTTSSSFFTPTAYLGSVQTIMGDSQVSSGALPPPPPSSPPPIPPSPPLSASPPCPISISSSLGSGDKVIATNQVRDDTSQNWEGGNGLELGSLPENLSSFDGSEMLNLPPPPSKPKGTKTVQRIEDNNNNNNNNEKGWLPVNAKLYLVEERKNKFSLIVWIPRYMSRKIK